ncbi:hypothetical protein C8J57DRAFT_1504513 [Mycena rebaudengoi]|nr:hypothetical protein C8J57DRAFT_1504513 [Mycena rebaudengoi]
MRTGYVFHTTSFITWLTGLYSRSSTFFWVSRASWHAYFKSLPLALFRVSRAISFPGLLAVYTLFESLVPPPFPWGEPAQVTKVLILTPGATLFTPGCILRAPSFLRKIQLGNTLYLPTVLARAHLYPYRPHTHPSLPSPPSPPSHNLSSTEPPAIVSAPPHTIL